MFKSISLFTKFLSLLFLASFFVLGTRSFIYGQESASITATVSISICGNGEVEGGEICDMKSLNHLTCKDFGYEYGELSCCLSCDEYDFSNCSNTIEELEEDVVSISLDDTSEEIRVEEGEIKDDFVQEEVNVKEKVELLSQENPLKNDDEDILPSVDNGVLINDVVLGENIAPQSSEPISNSYDIIQSVISRSPP